MKQINRGYNTYIKENSWFTQNSVLSSKSLGDFASVEYDKTWRFNLGKATSDCKKKGHFQNTKSTNIKSTKRKCFLQDF